MQNVKRVTIIARCTNEKGNGDYCDPVVFKVGGAPPRVGRCYYWGSRGKQGTATAVPSSR